jgi:hypothetical protein
MIVSDLNIQDRLLLYGQEGTGKSTIARAIARARDAQCIELSGGDMINEYQGSGAQCIHRAFEEADRRAQNKLHTVICIRVKNFKELLDTLKILKNPSWGAECKNRLQSFYHNATQKIDKADQEYSFEIELTGIPNKNLIIANAQNHLASYAGEIENMHSSDLVLLTSQIKDILKETNTLLSTIATELKATSYEIDQAYLLEHRDTLLTDKLFYEHALHYNSLVLNQHKTKTQRRLDKTFGLALLVFCVGKGVHTQLKSEGQYWDQYLEHAKNNPGINAPQSDFYTSQTSRDFIERLLTRKNFGAEKEQREIHRSSFWPKYNRNIS